MSFIDLVRNNKIKQPTQIGFSLKKWEDKWEELKSECKNEEQVYYAGKIIFKALGDVRAELDKLYSVSAPEIKNEELARSLFAVSNRDRFVLGKSLNDIDNKNIFSYTIDKNKIKNKLSFQEVADNCVDAISKGVFFCKLRMNKSETIKKGSAPLSVFDFVSLEAAYSNIYDIFEGYWQGVLWGDYSVEILDDGIHVIKQEDTELEVGFRSSFVRKSRLEAQTIGIIDSCGLHSFFDKSYVVDFKRVGKKKIFVKKKSSLLNEDQKLLNSSWVLSVDSLPEKYPKEVLNNTDSGFSIIEALDVFRCLMTLSNQMQDKYPQENSAYDMDKLNKFCPLIKKQALIAGLSGATGLDWAKVCVIMDFIEYDAKSDKDLWCHPIMSVSKTEYILLTSALVTPVINRVVEHWIVTLNLDLQDKGLVYEESTRKDLQISIKKCSYVNCHNDVLGLKFKVGGVEEEIDLVTLFNDIILIGEIKSIVTSDSPISQFRTVERLKFGADQINRKLAFIKNNLPEFFKKCSWEYNEEVDYKFVPFVCNSGKLYSGVSFLGVPVVDEKILTKYFEDNTFPLMSVREESGYKHISWLELYDDENSFKSNLSTYLSNPPQIKTASLPYEYVDSYVPAINEDAIKVVFRRILTKDHEDIDFSKMNLGFKVEKSEEFDSEIKNVDLVI